MKKVVLLAFIQKLLRGIRQFISIPLVLAIRVCFNISGWHCSLVTRQLCMIKSWVLANEQLREKILYKLSRWLWSLGNTSEALKLKTGPQNTWILFGKALTWSGAAVNNSPKRRTRMWSLAVCPSWNVSKRVGRGTAGFPGPLPCLWLSQYPETAHTLQIQRIKEAIPRAVLLLWVCLLYQIAHHSSHHSSCIALCARAPESSLGWGTLCSALLSPCLGCSPLSPFPICPHTALCRQLLGRKGLKLPRASTPLGWCVFL